MKRSSRKTFGIDFATIAALCLFVLAAPLAAKALKQIASIELPGPPGKRFDYLTIDYDDNYLLSAHLGAGILYVIDLATNKVVKAIPNVPGIEGVEYVPELKKVYTSDWGEDKIGVIDMRTMQSSRKFRRNRNQTAARMPRRSTRCMCPTSAPAPWL